MQNLHLQASAVNVQNVVKDALHKSLSVHVQDTSISMTGGTLGLAK